MRGNETAIIVEDARLSGATSGWGLSIEAAALDVTDLESTAAESEPGLVGVNLSQNGYFRVTAGRDLEESLHAALGSATNRIAVIIGTNDANPVAYALQAVHAPQLQVNAPTAEIVTVSGQWTRQATAERGRILYDDTASATGAGATLDLGATGTAGAAWLFVTGISGTASGATIDVETSADGSTWNTAATFTINGTGSQRAALSTVARYMRINVTSLGGATSITAVVIVAVDGVTQ